MPGEDELMDVRRRIAEAIADHDASVRDLERWECQFQRRQAEIQRRAKPEPEAKAAPQIAPPPSDIMEPMWKLLRAAYDFLAASLPFCEWDLPLRRQSPLISKIRIVAWGTTTT
jgi:hypothetical protein